MRALLGCLLCVVLTASQSFALNGGPPYPGSGANLVGTYAGVLQPPFCPVPDPSQCPGLNSIGVFSLGVPSTGLSTGTFIMFSRGRVFSGTINANADPRGASVRGLLNASYNYSLYVPNSTTGGFDTIAVTATAAGPLRANIVAPRRSGFGITATRITGEATLSITGGFVNGSGDPVVTSTLELSVSGFKQSDTATTTSAPAG
jgi:hypothetical protein